MMRRMMLLLTALMMIGCCTIRAEEMPPWEYPIDPEILLDPSAYLTLTNVDCLMDEKYVPHDLVRLSAKRVSSMKDGELRKAASDAVNAMFDAALEDGYTLYVKSAYRSYGTQNTMYQNRLERYGYDDGLVAYPGSSDHQTGLGVDVLNYEWTQKDGMNEKFALEAEAKWMAEHCHEFGFVIRYMEDKEDITGIKYEPWHLRYVGKEVAAYMMENHLSLEEFTEEWQAYVAEFEAAGGDMKRLTIQRRYLGPIIVVSVGEDGEEEYSYGN
ncbi:MAG: D-alanyl-D-alanine carboxypeptidase family protein [Clostridiales bacterium]|nr:D-alanyl-D-alanine carboxypeptidase family protein [Clostridiales bacterium]